MVQRLPSLNALRAFEAVARLQSVGKAAAELHVTHGAVSRQIRVLGTELGAHLFDRQGRGLVLTEHGRRLRDGVSAAFVQLQEACARVHGTAASAPLVLGVPGSVLARWLIPRLPRLTQALPELAINLAVVDTTPAPALPGLDAALLLMGPQRPPGWRVRVLAPERIAPVFSPAHPRAAALRRARITDLFREPLLHTRSHPQAWPDWARAQRVAARRLVFGQAFEHLYFMLEAAVAGLGVAIAPQQLVATDLAAGRLLAPWPFRATHVSWALCNARTADDARLQGLAAWLQHELALP